MNNAFINVDPKRSGGGEGGRRRGRCGEFDVC